MFFVTHCAKDDADTVNIMVGKLRQETHDPVLFYKPQSLKSDILRSDSFALALQTNFQQSVLEKHGGQFLCIDATHGLTGVDFQLAMIMVVDEFRHGRPEAFLKSHLLAVLGESLPYFLGVCSYVKSPLIISADLSRYSSGVVYLQYCGYCDNERLLDELSKQKPKLKANNDHDR